MRWDENSIFMSTSDLATMNLENATDIESSDNGMGALSIRAM